MGKILPNALQRFGNPSLEELETAAYDGRLGKIKGFSKRRVKSVIDSLAVILSRTSQHLAKERISGGQTGLSKQPPISLLLEIDIEYRRKAEAGLLNK